MTNRERKSMYLCSRCVQSLVRPKVIEPACGQLGVDNRVGDVPVSQVVLNGARIVPRVGQSETRRVSKHVRVDRERQCCLNTSPRHHLAHIGRGHRPTPFTGEYVSTASVLLTLHPT